MGFLDSLFGGGSKSSTRSTVISSLVTDIIAKNVMECRVQGKMMQDLSQTGNRNVAKNIVMRQSYTLNMECLQSSENMNRLQTEVANAVKQAAETQSIALLSVLGSSNSEIDNVIQNSVANNLTFENIQQQIGQMSMNQSIMQYGSKNIIEGVFMEQLSDTVRNAAQNITQKIDVIQKIENTNQQDAKATQENPFQFLADMFGDLMSGGTIIIIVIVIAVIILGIVFKDQVMFILTGKDPRMTQQTEPVSTQQTVPTSAPPTSASVSALTSEQQISLANKINGIEDESRRYG